jgi:hypothetical protein
MMERELPQLSPFNFDSLLAEQASLFRPKLAVIRKKQTLGFIMSTT